MQPIWKDRAQGNNSGCLRRHGRNARTPLPAVVRRGYWCGLRREGQGLFPARNQTDGRFWPAVHVSGQHYSAKQYYKHSDECIDVIDRHVVGPPLQTPKGTPKTTRHHAEIVLHLFRGWAGPTLSGKAAQQRWGARRIAVNIAKLPERKPS
jgi:hypothetical protein